MIRTLFCLSFTFYFLLQVRIPDAMGQTLRVAEGQLDLGQLDPEAINEVVGPWQVYWQELLQPPISSAQEYDQHAFGDIWPEKGVATFQIDVVPHPRFQVLTLSFPKNQGALKVWVNRTLIAEYGKVAKSPHNSISKAGFFNITFKVPNHPFTLTVQSSAYHHRTPGAFAHMQIALPQVIQQHREVGSATDLIICAILLFMGIFTLTFSLRSLTWQRDGIFLSLSCFAFGLRTIITSDTLVLYQFVDLPFDLHYRLEYLSFYIGTLVMYFFVRILYFATVPRLVDHIIVMITAVMSLLTILTPPAFFTRYLFIMQLTAVAAFAIAMWHLSKSIKEGIPDAKIFLAGFSCFAFSAIHDIFFHLRLVESVPLVKYGFVVFLFSQSLLLSNRFYRNQRRARESQLLMKMIEQAQKAFGGSASALAADPSIESAYYYQAAEQIGGDWLVTAYDDNKRYTFVALGDVAGHGTKSAMFTLMAISAIQTSFFHRKHDIANFESFLRGLAESSHQILLKPFQSFRLHTTAVFVVLDTLTGKGALLNAGHVPVYHMSHKSRYLTCSGTPLGLLGSAQFSVKMIHLDDGDSLFLYSDGVVENFNANGQLFTYRSLAKTLSHSHPSIDKIKRNLVSSIETAFPKGGHQDDITFLILRWRQQASSQAAPPGIEPRTTA